MAYFISLLYTDYWVISNSIQNHMAIKAFPGNCSACACVPSQSAFLEEGLLSRRINVFIMLMDMPIALCEHVVPPTARSPPFPHSLADRARVWILIDSDTYK